MVEPNIPGGYINIARKIIDSEIWNKPPLYAKVWIYLLTKAQHTKYKGLKRGQLYTSIPEIREACSWKVGYRKEVPKKDQVYQVIKWLRKSGEGTSENRTCTNMITTMKATQGMLVTINNYSFYQEAKNYESNYERNNEDTLNHLGKQRQSNNTNKNDKNVENDKNLLSIVNKEDLEPIHEIEKEFKNICNGYYAEFSIKRWTRDQWETVVDKFVSEVIKEKRYLNISRHKWDPYVYSALKNIAHKHDLKKGETSFPLAREDIQKDNILYYDWLSNDGSN